MVDDDDGDGFPYPEPRTDSRSALPREIRAWRRLLFVKRNENFSLIFSLQKPIYGVGVGVGGPPGGPRGRVRAQGGRPHPRGQGVGPLVFIFGEDFFIIDPKIFRGVSGHSENLYFLHIKQHHGNSAENNISPG